MIRQVIGIKFYDREKELAVLEKAYLRSGSDFIVISGRRRIGKSRLVEEFIKEKKALNLLIVPKEEKQVAKDLEQEIRLKTGYSPIFVTLKDALEYLFEQNTPLVYLDEFSNVLAVNQAIPYELQRLWDKYKESKQVMIIVSGSYAGMMNRLFTIKKAPLFNRATNTLSLEPLSFKTTTEILADFGVKSALEQIRFYCVFGGVPFYYVLIEKVDNRVFEDVVNALFFDVGAQLKEEGENVLRQEFGNAYVKYYAVLEAISAGYVSLNEISQKLGIRSTTLSKYLRALQQDYKLVERIVPYGEKPVRSKRGLYFVKDNTLSFWFSLVYGKTVVPSKQELDLFISKRFERLCQDFLGSYLSEQGERVLWVGKWWGSVKVGKKLEQREIDVVIETDVALYLGECKWTNQKISARELSWLKESAEGINKSNKQVKFVLFAKSGFEFFDEKDVLFFETKTIARHRH